MIAEHREEGITNIGNCVRCHRSGDDEGGEGRREGGGDDDG
jgi:mono/diheme cytochrome c family protein